MRTTINLPEDVYDIARSLAHARGLSLGDAVAELVRKGLEHAGQPQTSSPFPTFAVPAGAPPITLERTLELEDDEA